MAIIKASRIKLNLQQLLRKKIVMCVAVRIKMDFLKKKRSIFITRRKKVNLAAVTKEKTSHVYGSKEKNGFCSSC